MTDITAHLANIVERIARATEHARRARDSVQIIAISKQQPASAIAEAYAAGVRHFGESYVQEALPKMAELQGLDITWHFVGRLQANKTRAIAEHFRSIDAIVAATPEEIAAIPGVGSIIAESVARFFADSEPNLFLHLPLRECAERLQKRKNSAHKALY